MKFSDWLRAQADRDDPVGDLARDFVTDRRRRAVGVRGLSVRLYELGACDGAHRALLRAEGEFDLARVRGWGPVSFPGAAKTGPQSRSEAAGDAHKRAIFSAREQATAPVYRPGSRFWPNSLIGNGEGE